MIKLTLPCPTFIDQWRSRLRTEEKVEHQQEKEKGAAVIHLCHAVSASDSFSKTDNKHRDVEKEKTRGGPGSSAKL
jgi:hypothetical protein